jgi:hypothetical protein
MRHVSQQRGDDQPMERPHDEKVNAAQGVVEVDDRRQHGRGSRRISLDEHRRAEVEVAVVCTEQNLAVGTRNTRSMPTMSPGWS